MYFPTRFHSEREKETRETIFSCRRRISSCLSAKKNIYVHGEAASESGAREKHLQMYIYIYTLEGQNADASYPPPSRRAGSFNIYLTRPLNIPSKQYIRSTTSNAAPSRRGVARSSVCIQGVVERKISLRVTINMMLH